MFYLIILLVISASFAEHFSVQDEHGNPCLIMDGEFKFHLELTHEDETKQYSASMQKVNNVEGRCKGDHGNYLLVEFEPNDHKNDTSYDWELWFHFEKRENHTYALADYELRIKPTNTIPLSLTLRPNKTHESVIAHGNHGFKCSSLNLELQANSRIEINNARIISHVHLKDKVFPPKQEFDICHQDVHRHSSTGKIIIILVVVIILIVLFISGLEFAYYQCRIRYRSAYPGIN